jgi:hypothetical protein
MRGLSFRNKQGIEQLTTVRTWVQAVVVIWAPFEQQVVESNRVVYVAGTHLTAWLRSRPTRLTATQTARLRDKLSR